MANVMALHSVGASLITFLRNTYPDTLRAQFPCDFRLLSGAEVAGEKADMPTTLSLLLYRVVIDESLRTATRTRDPFDGRRSLPLDLHYLLTVWAANAVAEHSILGWAMRQIDTQPVLDTSLLSPEGGWSADESVQITPLDLSTDEILRLWDALTPAYRLSVAYVARVVRIDMDTLPDSLPVVASRFELEKLAQ
jgi:Pvc16 N-terminal domain